MPKHLTPKPKMKSFWIKDIIFSNTKIDEILIFPSKFFPGVSFGYSNLSIITLERCDKKNALESYCYSLKNTLSDKEKGVADKISEEDKEKIEDAVKETLDWIDDNESADASEFEEKQKDDSTTSAVNININILIILFRDFFIIKVYYEQHLLSIIINQFFKILKICS